MDKDIICRLCLGENEIALNLFTDPYDDNAPLKQIEKNFQVEIPAIRNWPSNICTCCMELLGEIQAFKESIEKNQITLRYMFDDVIVVEDDESPAPLSLDYEITDDMSRGSTAAHGSGNGIVLTDDRISSPSTQFGPGLDLVHSPLEMCEDDQQNNEDIEVKGTANIVRSRRFDPYSEITNNSSICSFCGKVLASKRSLEKHEYSFHNPNKISHRCKLCGFLSADIKKHMKSLHVKETPSKCTICKKVFRNRKHSQAHIQNVHGNEKHTCLACGKVYKQKRYLTEHMAVHTGVSLFKCYFCEDRFNTAGLRTAHCKRRHGDAYLEWKNNSEDWRTRRALNRKSPIAFTMDSEDSAEESHTEMTHLSVPKYAIFPILGVKEMNEYVQDMTKNDDFVQYLKEKFMKLSGLPICEKHNIWRKYFSDKLMYHYNYNGNRGKDKVDDNPMFRLLFECWKSATFTKDSWENFHKEENRRKTARSRVNRYRQKNTIAASSQS